MSLKETQIIHVDSPPQEGQPNSPPLNCGLHLVTYIQRVQEEKRDKINFTVENLARLPEPSD